VCVYIYSRPYVSVNPDLIMHLNVLAVCSITFFIYEFV
jgi:hypothetical protein